MPSPNPSYRGVVSHIPNPDPMPSPNPRPCTPCTPCTLDPMPSPNPSSNLSPTPMPSPRLHRALNARWGAGQGGASSIVSVSSISEIDAGDDDVANGTAATHVGGTRQVHTCHPVSSPGLCSPNLHCVRTSNPLTPELPSPHPGCADDGPSCIPPWCAGGERDEADCSGWGGAPMPSQNWG